MPRAKAAPSSSSSSNATWGRNNETRHRLHAALRELPRHGPAKDLKEFTAMLRANPGKVDYATCGVATIMHFTFELYKNATHTFAVHIPQRGRPRAAAALRNVHREGVRGTFRSAAAARG